MGEMARVSLEMDEVTITVEGDESAVMRWLQRLAESETGASASVSNSGRHPTQWTPDVAYALVDRITVNARRVLWYLMKHPPTVAYEDLQDHMELGGPELGGVMASFGYAEKAGLPRPFSVDRTSRRYTVDPAVTRVFLEALARHEERWHEGLG